MWLSVGVLLFIWRHYHLTRKLLTLRQYWIPVCVLLASAIHPASSLLAADTALFAPQCAERDGLNVPRHAWLCC
jgi:hypothetical protein